jgi:hypothetical protein
MLWLPLAMLMYRQYDFALDAVTDWLFPNFMLLTELPNMLELQ